jgi:hypothetical protein
LRINIKTEESENGEKGVGGKSCRDCGVWPCDGEDVADSVKTGIGSVAEILKTSPTNQTTTKDGVKKAAKKAPAKKAAKKTAANKSPAKNTALKKAANKSVKKPAKKAGRGRW